MAITLGLNQYLKEKRIEAGITQYDLGRRIGYDSGQLISNYERNMCGVPLIKMKKIIRILNLDPHYVIELIQCDQLKYLRQTLLGRDAKMTKECS